MIRAMPKKAEPRGNVKPRATLKISVRSRDNSSAALKICAVVHMAPD
jgi:hypothetical protein